MSDHPQLDFMLAYWRDGDQLMGQDRLSEPDTIDPTELELCAYWIVRNMEMRNIRIDALFPEEDERERLLEQSKRHTDHMRIEYAPPRRVRFRPISDDGCEIEGWEPQGY